ncbi:MAG: hypothetical protein K8S15_11755 [Candidatus Aegiribacteria sp.]|nr:hypothetical protein [Candidatus Aegiribacteria sp.]
MKSLLPFLLSCFALQPCTGSDLRFGGFADTYVATRLDDGNWNAMRTRLRANCSAQAGCSYMFVSLNAEKNHVLEEKTTVELREAYYEYAGVNWDVRAGRQIFCWGKADGIPVTDILCPGDYTEFITRDSDDIRMPVDAFQLRYLPIWGSIEVIWLPVFEPAVFASGDSPWAVEAHMSENEVLDASVLPERTLANSEIAGKVSLFTSGIDIALSAFYTWDDTPVLHRYLVNDDIHWQPQYHRLGYYGAEASKPLGEFVLRGELAFFQGKHFTDNQTGDRTVERNFCKGLAGLDWYPGNDWTVSSQLADDWVMDHSATMARDEHALQGTLFLSRMFMRQTLEIANMFYYGINDGDIYDQILVDYALSDALHAIAGGDIFAGPEGSGFGDYEDNTQVWFKIKYSF